MPDAPAPSGRTALVAGAARGIGLATAKRLALDGVQVTATWNRTEPTDRSDPGIRWRRCDITQPEQIAAVVDEARQGDGPFDVVVANAALLRDRMISRLSDDDLRAVLDVNLLGAFGLVRATLGDMAHRRWGRVVLVGSVGGSTGLSAQTSYAASKAALLGLARSLAREVGRRGVTVNVVAPGPIATELVGSMSARRREQWRQQTPAARFGEPAEVAAAISFLASEPGGAVTGALLAVDGGFLA